MVLNKKYREKPKMLVVFLTQTVRENLASLNIELNLLTKLIYLCQLGTSGINRNISEPVNRIINYVEVCVKTRLVNVNLSPKLTYFLTLVGKSAIFMCFYSVCEIPQS
uniref:Uncharacterized protein ORF107 n=1 Tax=Nothoceros aenigmaticus TaxID=13813 RepID=C3RYP9_9EMBR|nr:hypothetical protein MeaeMp48 [Nothoceros aenigmaticus]ACC86805.1 hypothetical protein MeaeMp48 [Nothoceros aenigmaticus]